MIPVLYEKSEAVFNSLGLGKLSDAISCLITEERNGMFELELTYPIHGENFAELQNDRIIKAKPSETADSQPFRIYRISRPIGGIVTVSGEHLSYRLHHIPISPFTASSAAEAVAGVVSHSAAENPFLFSTDISTVANFKVAAPVSARSLMGGIQGSLLDVFGGEYEYSGFQVFLRSKRGRDSGVKIKYGKNLKDLQQEESIAQLVTGVYPYWAGSEDGYVELPEKVIQLQSDYSFPRIHPLDLSGEFEEAPTANELRASAEKYITRTELSKPKVSLSVSFVQLWQTENYKNDPVYQQLAGLERVALCDEVSVEFLELGVSVSAKVIRTIYNTLLERYELIDLGEPRTNLATRALEQQKELEQVPSYTALQQAIDRATNAITGASGGYVVLDPPKNPQRILIMDTPDKATAQKVWQWNLNGLGYSTNGINGPYGLAMTMAGEIVADYITSGTLNANIIKAGILQDKNGTSKINLDTGDVDMKGIFRSSDGSQKMELSQGALHFTLDGELMGEITSQNQSGMGVPKIKLKQRDGTGRLSEVHITGSSFELIENGKTVGSYSTHNGQSNLLASHINIVNDGATVGRISGSTGSIQIPNVFTDSIRIGADTVFKNTYTINGTQYKLLSWG